MGVGLVVAGEVAVVQGPAEGPLILVGPGQLEAVLDRPAPAGLKSCVCDWHRLTVS
ncbi:hypothetical protein [Streptomyces broussonetiae]|uniref:Uncharacterized protein n=1 Tax=Streptomyces broussonetiae TaxID=2686304 RepID=A0A6I6MSG7_9ACTN|nr:hypothetical protein [Streptomyces broussonetiae]QHA02422.1 hypothetical protein GQF42_03150 [Streptomyces broussonetiae]